MSHPSLGWLGIARLGLVQAALGAIVVLTTSTMNRVMVVELALPAMLPGALVALHYAVQILRPHFGYGSDRGGRRTPWILGGMATLAAGAVLAASAIATFEASNTLGVALSVLAFLLIGFGVGAAGTSLLVLLATRVDEHRRAAAATVVWLMMIVGFVVSTLVVGLLLDPYSAGRLLLLTAAVGAAAVLLTLAALHGLEPRAGAPGTTAGDVAASDPPPPFRVALAEVWSEPQARRFTVFIFVSMLAYSAQDLILEPFAGAVFGMTPGESTRLSSLQHGGVLVGMLLVAMACSAIGGARLGSLRGWTTGGCLASAVALLGLVLAGRAGGEWPLAANVFALGVANGAFAVAAIGSMMGFAGSGRARREGVRMGLWGAAQAIAFAIGGFAGAAASDLTRGLFASPGIAYGLVFATEALLFIAAAVLAARLGAPSVATRITPLARPHALPLASQERPA
jgi:BCD family chlorophyll transporter-like MFS transporter